MPSLPDIARARTDLTGPDLEWLHLLLADWQLLADLSFADLVLWLPVAQTRGFVAAAQMRPTTGPTALPDDLVGLEVGPGRRSQLDRAFGEARICRERDPDWPREIPVREETIPVLRDGRVAAVVARLSNLAAGAAPGPRSRCLGSRRLSSRPRHRLGGPRHHGRGRPRGGWRNG